MRRDDGGAIEEDNLFFVVGINQNKSKENAFRL